MHFKFIFIVLLSLASSSLSAVVFADLTPEAKPVASAVDKKTTVPPETTTTATTTIAPNSTTTEPTTTTTTTTKAPETTTTTTTTVTPKTTTTTTTVTPKTTTTSTTVSPETTTTTTEASTTTTVAPKTTVVPPSPTPPAPTPVPQPGVWYVQDAKANVTCIVAKMLINLNITYPATNGTKHAEVVIAGTGNETKVEGSCGNSSQTLQIDLPTGHSLRLSFAVNATDKKFALGDILLTVNATALPDAHANLTKIVYEKKDLIFVTALNMSYVCNKLQTLNLTSPTNLTATFTVSQTQLQAFREDTQVKFGAAQDCEPLDTPDMVPIAVGVSLGVMILVVLVAYLIGRRRSRNLGYVSM